MSPKDKFRAFVHCIYGVNFIPFHPWLFYHKIRSVPKKYPGGIVYYHFFGSPVKMISVALIKRELPLLNERIYCFIAIPCPVSRGAAVGGMEQGKKEVLRIRVIGPPTE